MEEKAVVIDVWQMPLLIGGAALLVGLYFAFRVESGDKPIDGRSELQAQKERHLEALRELEADVDKLDPQVYSQERERLLGLAEDVLRKLEEGDTASVPTSTKWTPTATSDLGTLFFLLVGCVMALGLFRYSKDRGEGETLTGASMQANVQAYQQSLMDAQKTLESDPENKEALHLLTYNALLNGQLQVAMKHIEVVRQKYPTDPELLVHMGILKLAIQSYDQAILDFNAAIAAKEDLGKAYLWRALLYSNLKQNEQALADAQKALPLVTLIEEKRFLSSLMDDLQKPPPIVSGSVEISNPSDGVLFVIARRNETGGGPPVAVKRYRPMEAISFELGKSDMVMGGVWPEKIWLEARLDADGNVMTKDDARSSALIGPIEGVQEGIALTIEGGSAAPTEASAAKISGQISAGENAPQGLIFMIARTEQGAKGPPLAVKRIASQDFPISFSMGEGDLMMGGTWPDAVWLEARLDTDGDAMTKTDLDWYSEGTLVQTGSAVDVVLVPKK